MDHGSESSQLGVPNVCAIPLPQITVAKYSLLQMLLLLR